MALWDTEKSLRGYWSLYRLFDAFYTEQLSGIFSCSPLHPFKYVLMVLTLVPSAHTYNYAACPLHILNHFLSLPGCSCFHCGCVIEAEDSGFNRFILFSKLFQWLFVFMVVNWYLICCSQSGHCHVGSVAASCAVEDLLPIEIINKSSDFFFFLVLLPLGLNFLLTVLFSSHFLLGFKVHSRSPSCQDSLGLLSFRMVSTTIISSGAQTYIFSSVFSYLAFYSSVLHQKVIGFRCVDTWIYS